MPQLSEKELSTLKDLLADEKKVQEAKQQFCQCVK